MKTHLGKLICCLIVLLFAIPASAKTTRIWVLNMGSNGTDSIDVIDPTTNQIVQKFDGIAKPHGVVFSPDGSRAYVASEDESASDSLFVLDAKTGQILSKAPLSGRRGNVPTITADGKRLLVCVGAPRDERGIVKLEGGSLDVVDTASLKILQSFPMTGHDCYTTPDGKYWISGSGKNLVVFDIATQKSVWKIYYPDSVATVGIEPGPDGSTKRLFVAQIYHLARDLSIVDFAKHEEVSRINLPDTPKTSSCFTFRTEEHNCRPWDLSISRRKASSRRQSKCQWSLSLLASGYHAPWFCAGAHK